MASRERRSDPPNPEQLCQIMRMNETSMFFSFKIDYFQQWLLYKNDYRIDAKDGMEKIVFKGSDRLC